MLSCEREEAQTAGGTVDRTQIRMEACIYRYGWSKQIAWDFEELQRQGRQAQNGISAFRVAWQANNIASSVASVFPKSKQSKGDSAAVSSVADGRVGEADDCSFIGVSSAYSR